MNVTLPELVHRHSPNYSTRHSAPISLLVWHETAGAYEGAVSWLCNPAAQASAHIVVREDGNEATQLVALHDKAWHAAAFNSQSVGVEHANTTAKGYANERQLQVSARIFGWLCLHLNIPPRFSTHRGVCRHSDLGKLGGGHYNCGPGDHDWHRFLEMLHAEIARGHYRRDWAS